MNYNVFCKLTLAFFIVVFATKIEPTWSWNNITNKCKRVFVNKKIFSSTYSHEIKEKSSLNINAIDGTITLISNPQNLVKIIANKNGTDEEAPFTQIETKLVGNKVTVNTIEKDLDYAIPVDYTIAIPSNITNINISSRCGNVIINNIDTICIVNIDSGNLTINGSTKYTRATIKDGTIVCNSPNGAVDLTVETGNIFANNVSSNITAKIQKNGNINIIQEILPPSGYILADVLKGNVDLKLPKNVKAQLNVHTTSGILTSTIPVTLETRTTTLTKESWKRMEREAIGTIGNCQDICAPITIDVIKGNITISPKD